MRFHQLLSVSAWRLLMTVLLAMTSARADAVVPEPVEALVANHSVARRGDGTVLLLMPPGQLLVSRDAHPLTLENFAEPVTLFGESGILANRRPDSAAIAAEGDAVHVIFTINHRLHWYTSSGPLAPTLRNHLKSLIAA